MGTYKNLLLDPRWQRRRLKRLEAANWQCQQCGDGSSELQIHHVEYIDGLLPWEYTDSELQCLCDSCHKDEHTPLTHEQAAAVAIIDNMPPDVFCDRCGRLVTNDQGYGWSGPDGGAQRTFLCDMCLKEDAPCATDA